MIILYFIYISTAQVRVSWSKKSIAETFIDIWNYTYPWLRAKKLILKTSKIAQNRVFPQNQCFCDILDIFGLTE